MTWIRTIPLSDGSAAGERLRAAYAVVMAMYPAEYGRPSEIPELADESIVASHSLIPEALEHAFATFGSLMSSDLPLTRRQHEMITTRVSAVNRCHY